MTRDLLADHHRWEAAWIAWADLRRRFNPWLEAFGVKVRP